MARGAREVSRLIKAMGGNEITAYGLCHLGDYEATLFSESQTTEKYGENFVKGTNSDNYLAEGVTTAEALVKLSKKYNIDMPITSGVNAVLKEEVNPHKMLKRYVSQKRKKRILLKYLYKTNNQIYNKNISVLNKQQTDMFYITNIISI